MLDQQLSETIAATGCNICRVPSGMSVVDWHNPRVRELVIWLTGEVETGDGDVRRVAAGGVVLAEDTTGKGDISRHLKDNWSSTSTSSGRGARPVTSAPRYPRAPRRAPFARSASNRRHGFQAADSSGPRVEAAGLTDLGRPQVTRTTGVGLRPSLAFPNQSIPAHAQMNARRPLLLLV